VAFASCSVPYDHAFTSPYFVLTYQIVVVSFPDFSAHQEEKIFRLNDARTAVQIS
jgi:hypothetical protein